MSDPIDATHYAIVGYIHTPVGAFVDVATPHLLEVDAKFTLCGRVWQSRVFRVQLERAGRAMRWAKPVCRRCAAKEAAR